MGSKSRKRKKLRTHMPINNQNPTRFADELRIISPWAYFIAVLGFLTVLIVVIVATLTDKNPPPLPVMVVGGLVVGFVAACYIILIGYINRDAGRRGMSRLLWTLMAICIPNALGIVLYFVLRKPRTMICPQCAAMLEPGFGFCPRCRYRVTPVCPHCQRSVHEGDKYCPYCGTDLAPSPTQVTNQAQSVTS